MSTPKGLRERLLESYPSILAGSIVPYRKAGWTDEVIEPLGFTRGTNSYWKGLMSVQLGFNHVSPSNTRSYL